MDKQLEQLTPKEIREDMTYIRSLIARAEAEGSADALAAKSLFL